MWENLKFVLSNTDIIRLARSVLPLGASVWLYTPLCQTRAASCWLTLSICFFRVAYPWPSRASITSSTKPEVHNVSQRHQSRNEPRPLITRTHKTFVDWTWSFGDMLVDRQTDRQTDTPIAKHRNTCTYVSPQRAKKLLVCMLHYQLLSYQQVHEQWS